MFIEVEINFFHLLKIRQKLTFFRKHNKLNIVTLVQEYTIYLLKVNGGFICFSPFGASANKPPIHLQQINLYIPSQKSRYWPCKEIIQSKRTFNNFTSTKQKRKIQTPIYLRKKNHNI